MKRGLFVLLAVVFVGLLATVLTKRCLQGPPSVWLCHEYGLSPKKASYLNSLQNDYGVRCGPFCEKMCAANARLEELYMGSESVTPAIRNALAETDRIRTETRITMLDHFYAVAAELPPGRRREYLLKVLPLIIDTCGSR